MEQGIKPKSIFDQVLVRDMTDTLWAQQRCKQNVAALVTSSFVEALACLLRTSMAPAMMEFGDRALEVAREYYGGAAEPKRLEEIDCLLAQLEITPAHIRAKAMQLCGSDIAMFNRMSSSCEISLRQLRKELEGRPGVQNDPVISPKKVMEE